MRLSWFCASTPELRLYHGVGLFSPQRITPFRKPVGSLFQKHWVSGHIQSLHRLSQQRPAGPWVHVQALPPTRGSEQVRHRLEEVGRQPPA